MVNIYLLRQKLVKYNLLIYFTLMLKLINLDNHDHPDKLTCDKTLNTPQTQPDKYITQSAPTPVPQLPDLTHEIEAFFRACDESFTQNTQTSSAVDMDPNVQQWTGGADHRKRTLDNGYQLENGKPTKSLRPSDLTY